MTLARFTAAGDYPAAVWYLALGGAVTAAGSSMVIPLFTLFFTDRFDVGLATAGSLAALFFLGGMLGQGLGGHLADVIGRRPVMLASIFGSAAATLCVGLLPTFELDRPDGRAVRDVRGRLSTRGWRRDRRPRSCGAQDRRIRDPAGRLQRRVRGGTRAGGAVPGHRPGRGGRAGGGSLPTPVRDRRGHERRIRTARCLEDPGVAPGPGLGATGGAPASRRWISDGPGEPQVRRVRRDVGAGDERICAAVLDGRPVRCRRLCRVSRRAVRGTASR